MDITELLAFAVKNKASDLHLSAGLPPMIRVHGDIRRINLPPMEHEDVHAMVYDIMSDAQRKNYEENLEADFSFAVPNLAHVVRERFKILRQVRVYTAHGRLTGYVLLALPAFLCVALAFINPDHMNLLFRERMGQMLLMVAITMQIIGYFWIRQVVKIEV